MVRFLRFVIAALTSTLAASVFAINALPVYATTKPNTAQEILQDAQTHADQQHKLVFFVFGASWCGPCHALDDFIAAPEIAPILNKYFVFAEVHIEEENGKHPELNTPGGEKLMAKFGGLQGVPFIVFFNSKGELLVTSSRPVAGHRKGDNIGYPDAPEEIDWFLQMLKKTVPEIQHDELQKIEAWLRKASHYPQPAGQVG